ncbi:MAG: hypothetical protein KDE45_23280, partial [Caldilineaceae bacterium]|nr:hypothetical protein [Caldilineaceae bacterium]
IDEIDKAEADLPNGLLEALGNGSFQVPYLNAEIGLGKDMPPPLVIVTTNEDRELPAAFLRRCLVLKMKLPEDDADLIDCLVKRGGEHFGDDCDEVIRTTAAEMLVTHRNKPQRPRPGQAEYLDMLRALALAHPGNAAAQGEMLDRIHPFALDKAAPAD